MNHLFWACPLTTLFFIVMPAVGQGKKDSPEGERPSVSVRELCITLPASDVEEGFDGRLPSTLITIMVRMPGKRIIGCDMTKSKIHQLTDSVGTNLLDGKSLRTNTLFPSVNTSKTGSVGKITILAGGFPTSGATFIRLKADVVLQTGKDEKKSQPQKLRLALGEWSIGPVLAKVIDDDGRRVLSMEATLDEKRPIKYISVLDQRGRTIRDGWGSTSGDGKKMTECLVLTREMTEATIVVTTYETIETITVPVDLKIDIGGAIEKSKK